MSPVEPEPVNWVFAGNLYGRGASDNKAPVLAWIHAVEAYQALSMVRTFRFFLCLITGECSI